MTFLIVFDSCTFLSTFVNFPVQDMVLKNCLKSEWIKEAKHKMFSENVIILSLHSINSSSLRKYIFNNKTTTFKKSGWRRTCICFKTSDKLFTSAHMFVRNASPFHFLNSNLHYCYYLSMETEQDVKNNNQIAKIQKGPTASHESTAESMNGVYICMPSVHSLKAFQHYRKFNKDRQANNNHVRLKVENHTFYDNSNEEPMDLTCTEKRDIEGATSLAENVLPLQSNAKLKLDAKNTEFSLPNVQHTQNGFIETHIVKKRGRKRKYVVKNSLMIQELPMPNLESDDMLKVLNNPDVYQAADNRQTEVLKAAKSLFSKRTRTLFHWMYPNAPKAQLKAAVATSWETLGEQEKEFYISQVLGRFGFPQTNLMVNPQLGGLSGILSLPPLDLTRNLEINEETSTAVSSLLLSENGGTCNGPWMHASTSSNRPSYTQRINRKRGRLGRPPGSRNRKRIKEEFPILKQITDEPTPDEFQDDPELSREFQQFKWTLHFNDNNKQ